MVGPICIFTICQRGQSHFQLRASYKFKEQVRLRACCLCGVLMKPTITTRVSAPVYTNTSHPATAKTSHLKSPLRVTGMLSRSLLLALGRGIVQLYLDGRSLTAVLPLAEMSHETVLIL